VEWHLKAASRKSLSVIIEIRALKSNTIPQIYTRKHLRKLHTENFSHSWIYMYLITGVSPATEARKCGISGLRPTSAGLKSSK